MMRFFRMKNLKIRTKAMLIVCIVLLTLMIAMIAISRELVIRRFVRLETDSVKAHVQRTLNELDNTLKRIESVVGDWAPWDETYEFVKDRNSAYIDGNLIEETFINLNLSFMLFLNERGELVHQKHFDPSAGKAVPNDPLIEETLRKIPQLTEHASPQSRHSGIVMTPSAPLFVASAPILTSNHEGPTRGTLIVGRYLDQSEIDRISTLLQLPIRIHPHEKTAAVFAADEKGHIQVRPKDAQTVIGYAQVSDLTGKPAIGIEVILDRKFYRNGNAMWQQHVISIVVLGIIFIVLLMFLLNKIILNHVTDLTRQVNDIGKDHHHDLRIRIRSNDEIGQLAESINAMLGSLRQYHERYIENEKRYRAIVEDQTDLICRTSKEGNLIFVNEAFCRFFGGSTDEWLGKPITDLIPFVPDSREGLDAPESATPYESVVEDKIILSNGMTKWLQWRHRRIRSDSGDEFGWQSVGRNITEQKLAENALQENERYLREVLDSINCGVVVVNARDRRIVDINAAGAAMMQCNMEDIIGRVCHQFFCPQEMGGCPVLDQDQVIEMSERKLLKSDGETLPILKSVFITVRNGQRYLIESFIDMSSLKKAEADLRASEERYRRFFEDDLTGDLVSSIDGRLIDCNLACAKIFGYDSVEEVKQLNINIKDYYLNPADCNVIFNQLRRKKHLERYELKLRHRNGKPLYCIANLIGEFNENGKLTEIRGYLFDDTKRVELEKEMRRAQKMEAMGTLAGGIAHDFNNILAAIVGYTELSIRKLPNDSEVGGYLRNILTAGERARDLIRQILTFSRRQETVPQPIQVQMVIHDVIKLIRASLPATIDIQQEINSRATVMADQTELHQVIMNLCANAAHAMKEGGTLTITLDDISLDKVFTDRYPEATPGDFVRMRVRDTGEGIPDHLLDRIFDPFFTTKPKDEGTGLGLSMVHGIVSNMKGIITVESEPGKGTQFDIYLPRLQETPETEQIDHEMIPDGSEHVVYVDDESFLAEIGKEMLRSLGYRVTAFTKSSEALSYLMEHHDEVDLVITDMTMPHVTGLELARHLTHQNIHLPVIICTGYTNEISPENASALGIREFITKPITLKNLADTVRKVLES